MPKNKKILITGSSGFIGSRCVDYFSKIGFDVFGIDIFESKMSNFIKGVINPENIQSFNQEFDVIIHLAGSSTVGAARENPTEEFQKTVNSTCEILEYIRKCNPQAKLIYSSSAAVYGDSYNERISEKFKLNPISIYGQHKVEAEKLCEKYHKEYNLKINIIRFFSIYGEGLKKQLLWDLSNKIKKGDTANIKCFGTGKEKRDFLHVQDAIELINLLIEKGSDFEIINGATGLSTEVECILNNLSCGFSFKGEFVFDNISREGDPKSLVADIAKAQSFGFLPKVKVEDGIKNYVRWFKQNC